MKAPLHKPCGTNHWSTEPCPADKKSSREKVEGLKEGLSAKASLPAHKIVDAIYIRPTAGLLKRIDNQAAEHEISRSNMVRKLIEVGLREFE